jgi:hypothetical protein
MGAIVEAELDAAVFKALALEAIADAEFVHELDGAVFKEASADALFDVLAGAEFEDDGVDAEAVEEQGEEEAGGAGADDGYLGAHVCVLRVPCPVRKILQWCGRVPTRVLLCCGRGIE